MKKSLRISIASENKKQYPILFGKVAQCLPQFLHTQKNRYRSIVIITDSTVRRFYGNTFPTLLRDNADQIRLLSFPAGEKSKTATVKNFLDEQLLKKGCGRDTLIVALGGGVVGDMAGFVASTYLRGVPYIQVPTTLLAMVDSSIGGKTGIDMPYGKNMIGTFWQPSAVIIDTTFLATLPLRHVQNGLLEAIKMHLVCGVQYRGRGSGSSNDTIQNIIHGSLTAKARVVQRDEKESGERMILNFGHTIGHAIEKVSGYSVLHGIAIGYGMLVEAHISHELGILPSIALRKVNDILHSGGISSRALRKWDAHAIMAATKYDKKRRGQQPLYILLRDIGVVHHTKAAWAHPVSDSVVHKTLSNLKAES
ncbi:3-dehydroquinate synthase [Candidatus Uhrbacteria bacterium]|nr:3-dehydroquinate synthase [Candidatus Uhrbacteria bacterium]